MELAEETVAPLSGADSVVAAKRIATQAHRGQVDKAGAPYLDHPARVAEGVHSFDEQAVAWLHDVVEDTQVDLDSLREVFSPRIVEAVDAITARPDEARETYYQRVRANELALSVNFADIRDNSNPARLAKLDSETQARLTAKYTLALEQLTK